MVDAASLASRDCTLLSAYRTIHEANYDFTKACEALTPNTSSQPGEVNVGPKFFRDEFEDWSKSEVQLFEEGNQKFQKGFSSDISFFLIFYLKSSMQFATTYCHGKNCPQLLSFITCGKQVTDV